MRTAQTPLLALLLVALLGSGCSSDRDRRRGRTAAEGPLTRLPPAEDEKDKVVCVRAEASTFDPAAEEELLDAISLADGTQTDPGGRNGLVVYQGGKEFAIALAEVFRSDARSHAAQLLTVRTGHAATLVVGPGAGEGRFPFWGTWEGRELEGEEARAKGVVPRLRVRPLYRSDGQVELLLTPALASTGPEPHLTVLSGLGMRVTVPSGGVALVGSVGEGTFGSWFLTRKTESGLDRIFMVLHVHCLN